MTKDEFVSLLCENLNVDKYTVAKKKYGNTPELTYGRILEAIYIGKTIPGIAEQLGTTVRTTNRILNEYVFPQIDKAIAKPWRTRLLERVGYKTCNSCEEIKPIEDFYLYPSVNKGIKNRSEHMYRCKSCDSTWTLEKYKCFPYIHRAANNKYRALQYSVNSMCNADEVKIKLIYKECPSGYEVDHIIPLSKGGLHNEYNLCYLTSIDNSKKGSKMPEDVLDIMERAIYPLKDDL